MSTNMPINPHVKVGHVHLKVADLERSLAFYCEVPGFEVIQRMGKAAAFISSGGYHHHIGLNTWESAGGVPPPGFLDAASARANVQPMVSKVWTPKRRGWKK